jgi:hypothetical protein
MRVMMRGMKIIENNKEQVILNSITADAPIRQLLMTLWWRVFNQKKSRALYHYTIVMRYSWEKTYKLIKEKKYRNG